MFGLPMLRRRLRSIDKAERKRAHLRYQARSGIVDDRLAAHDRRPRRCLYAGMRRDLAIAYAPRRP